MEACATAFDTDRTDAVGALSSELTRLGCGFRNCGFHGLIFVPRSTGGFNFEHGMLHYWDLGVNRYFDWEHAHERLARLPNNAGRETVCNSLLEMDPA